MVGTVGSPLPPAPVTPSSRPRSSGLAVLVRSVVSRIVSVSTTPTTSSGAASRKTQVNDSEKAWRTRPADAAGSPRSESGGKEAHAPTLTDRPTRRPDNRELSGARRRDERTGYGRGKRE